MTQDELKQLALDVADEVYGAPIDRHAAIQFLDFALCFLAAIQERSEPVAWYDPREHEIPDAFSYLSFQDSLPLYTHPSFAAPQEQKPELPSTSDTEAPPVPVGAAPLPEEVKAMVQALRNEFATSKRACEAADMIERLAALKKGE